MQCRALWKSTTQSKYIARDEVVVLSSTGSICYIIPNTFFNILLRAKYHMLSRGQSQVNEMVILGGISVAMRNISPIVKWGGVKSGHILISQLKIDFCIKYNIVKSFWDLHVVLVQSQT